MRINTKKVTMFSLFTTLALVLSYIESLIPPIFAATPGIKIGLPNIVIIFILYKFSFKNAATVSFLRVFLVALLFGNAVVLLYSLAGAVLSLTVMVILKKTNAFSILGVSVAGAVSHNLGQTVVAIILLQTKEIGYYMIPLFISGIVAGVFVGIIGALLLKRFDKIKIF